MLCFIFFKLYLACYSKEKRDVVSLHIALLSCAQGVVGVEDRIKRVFTEWRIKEQVSSNQRLHSEKPLARSTDVSDPMA